MFAWLHVCISLSSLSVCYDSISFNLLQYILYIYMCFVCSLNEITGYFCLWSSKQFFLRPYMYTVSRNLYHSKNNPLYSSKHYHYGSIHPYVLENNFYRAYPCSDSCKASSTCISDLRLQHLYSIKLNINTQASRVKTSYNIGVATSMNTDD